ncbi:MAG: lanthionine synthetase LanC family protein [Catenulispora sp.]
MPTNPAKLGNAALAEGIAHGEAGVVLFLAEYAHATGDPAAVRAARDAGDRLAALTPGLVARAAAPDASRRYGSWCRGLAGIGSVLLTAADRLAEPGYRDLAEACADACARCAPLMPQVIQCCGLAGVGDFLIDTALATGAERRWAEAGAVARLVLARSGGSWSKPDFPDVNLTRTSAGWAGGAAGMLAFLRRLRDHGGPRVAHPAVRPGP